MEFKIGDRIKFISSTKNQVNWGSNDDPTNLLDTHTIYEIEYVEVHSYHTKISIVGVKGRFNSVSFELLPIKELRKEKLDKLKNK